MDILNLLLKGKYIRKVKCSSNKTFDALKYTVEKRHEDYCPLTEEEWADITQETWSDEDFESSKDLTFDSCGR